MLEGPSGVEGQGSCNCDSNWEDRSLCILCGEEGLRFSSTVLTTGRGMMLMAGTVPALQCVAVAFLLTTNVWR